MKTLIAIAFLVAPWIIFVIYVAALGRPNLIGLVITLAVSAYGLTLLISKKK